MEKETAEGTGVRQEKGGGGEGGYRTANFVAV